MDNKSRDTGMTNTNTEGLGGHAVDPEGDEGLEGVTGGYSPEQIYGMGRTGSVSVNVMGGISRTTMNTIGIMNGIKHAEEIEALEALNQEKLDKARESLDKGKE